MSWLGLGPASVARRAQRGAATPITADALPALDSLTAGETLSVAVSWGSYSSIVGSIVSPTTKEMSVNGGAYIPYNGATVVSAADTYRLRETVSDDQGNSRTFATGAQTVSGVAPSVTASDSLSGRTLTITVDSTTGTPAPSVALTALTLDGVDVSGDATGSGPWEYVGPDSETLQTVAWMVTATNFVGSDTASGSEAIAANLFAPTADTSPSIGGTVAPGQIVTITKGTYSGTPSPTIIGTLTLGGADVTADMTGLDYTIPAGTEGQDLVWTETATNGVSPDATQSVTETILAPTTAPSISNLSIDETNEIGKLNVTTDKDATLYVWVGPTGTTPTAQEIKDGTGADHSESVAITLFGGPYDLTLPAGLSGDYRVSVVAQDGSSPLSNVLTQSPVAFDTTPLGLMAESVLFDTDTTYARYKSFTTPALAPGNYLIFYFNDAGKIGLGFTLENTDAQFYEFYETNNVRIEVWTVTNLPGGGDQTLYMDAQIDSFHGIEVVRVGDGVIAEAKKSNTEDVTPTDTQAGMAIHAMFVTDDAAGYVSSNSTILTPATTVNGNRGYVSGYLLDISAGSTPTLTHDWDGTFRYYSALGVKLIDGAA